MLFNSYSFLFIFLPLVWLGWRLALRFGGLRAGVAWLAMASLCFYTYMPPTIKPGGQQPSVSPTFWECLNWRYTLVLVFSLFVNYWLGRRLAKSSNGSRFGFLLTGLVWNLGLLGYFKYWFFVASNFNALLGTHAQVAKLILPLGISFFTFQKIAFLVDAYKGKVKDVKFLDFALFVLFFPQLLAGPIVHHGEFIPQIREDKLSRVDWRRVALGCSVFAAGLFQKCVVADTIAVLADNVFGLAAQGTHLRMVEAWTGAVAYTVQLFFDFSGYSHMALGLALIFGFRLPINFLAPYTSGSMIEFWRRWHITLSAFLRDYVYIPLGGNRNRHLTNLLITMVIGGFWHGAGWTFILWGAWHGVALLINHVWVGWKTKNQKAEKSENREPLIPAPPLWANVLTMAVVTFGWVLFRANDVKTAWLLMQGMVGYHGISVPAIIEPWVRSLAPIVRPRGLFPNISVTPCAMIMLILGAAFACRGPRLLKWLGVTAEDVTLPAKRQIEELAPVNSELTLGRAIVIGLMFAIAVATLARVSPFLYYQF